MHFEFLFLLDDELVFLEDGASFVSVDKETVGLGTGD